MTLDRNLTEERPPTKFEERLAERTQQMYGPKHKPDWDDMDARDAYQAKQLYNQK